MVPIFQTKLKSDDINTIDGSVSETIYNLTSQDSFKLAEGILDTYDSITRHMKVRD